MNKGLIAVVILLLLLPLIGSIQQDVNRSGSLEIRRFSSYGELRKFIEVNTKAPGRSWWPSLFGQAGAWRGLDMVVPEAAVSPSSAPDYSVTNIQVAGVDEADIVKTDGEYIYLVSADSVIVVKAYPPEEARVLSKIELEGMVMGIFVNKDRLVVFEVAMPHYEPVGLRGDSIEYISYASPRTSVKVYDVSDREHPSLQRELSADGWYVSSRMIGDYVYVIVNDSAYDWEGEVKLPVILYEEEEREIPAEDIYYCDVYDYSYTYTTIIAINTQDDDHEPTSETILLGTSSNLYVSRNNIYLTFPVWGRSMWDSQGTSIHRINIDADEIEYVASGEVPGMVLNQFSMDEYEGYFRVATTTRGRISLNHVYTMDMDLEIVGKLENLAPTEMIYSARFMGERAYLVTFEIIDPLFVIDLKDPYEPEVLGELKITGYSDYLHPYDQNHLIGIGKETLEAEEGDFSWMQGVKISLFDVSDVNNPQEIAKYEIGQRGTDSPVSRDHKAFLFDNSRNLMVLPVCVAEIDEADYPDGVPIWAWGKPVWQGAYVFHVSPDAGLRLEGGITHFESLADQEEYYYYCFSPFSVQRSLYIGDVLYTISDAMIKMNSLENLDYINEVELPFSTWEYPYYIPEEPWDDESSVDDASEGERPSNG